MKNQENFLFDILKILGITKSRCLNVILFCMDGWIRGYLCLSFSVLVLVDFFFVDLLYFVYDNDGDDIS